MEFSTEVRFHKLSKTTVVSNVSVPHLPLSNMAWSCNGNPVAQIFILILKNMPKKQKFPYLVGSKWTSLQTTWGWRHFQVVNRKNEGKWVFAEMVAACDPNVRFWLNAKQLKDYSLWQAGWQSLQKIKTANPLN